MDRFVGARSPFITTSIGSVRVINNAGLTEIDELIFQKSPPQKVSINFSNTSLDEGDLIGNTLFQEFGISFGSSAILVRQNGERCGYRNQTDMVDDRTLVGQATGGPAISDQKVKGDSSIPSNINIGLAVPVYGLKLFVVDIDSDESYELRSFNNNNQLQYVVFIDNTSANTGDGISTRLGLSDQMLCYGASLRIIADQNGVADFAVDNISFVPAIKGDVNLDGAVNLLDIEPFVSLLSTGEFRYEADTNNDGVVNLLDVEPFIFLLSN
ncbi:MAG: dockerin type I domain-containing protein [Planctomycetota bacterium]